MKQSQITEWCHEILRAQAPVEGSLYIDATMGKGQDTLFLCRMAGTKGRVLAFDIQNEAIEITRRLLDEHSAGSRARLILDGHEHMDRYAQEGSADVICFNFGYLPGGDHAIATRPETSIEAIKKGPNDVKRFLKRTAKTKSGETATVKYILDKDKIE